MKNFTLCQNGVEVIGDDNRIVRIFFNQNSGKAFYRMKINTVVGIKHPGIYIGSNQFGKDYFIHNHYQIGHACLVDSQEFSKGYPLEVYTEACSNDWLTVVRIAFEQAVKKESYHFLKFNCQTLVNQACHNQRRSEDADKWGSILFGGLLALGIGALISD